MLGLGIITSHSWMIMPTLLCHDWAMVFIAPWYHWFWRPSLKFSMSQTRILSSENQGNKNKKNTSWHMSQTCWEHLPPPGSGELENTSFWGALLSICCPSGFAASTSISRWGCFCTTQANQVLVTSYKHESPKQMVPSGKQPQFAIENGSVEIVDLPIDSMVISHSYVNVYQAG